MVGDGWYEKWLEVVAGGGVGMEAGGGRGEAGVGEVRKKVAYALIVLL